MFKHFSLLPVAYRIKSKIGLYGKPLAPVSSPILTQKQQQQNSMKSFPQNVGAIQFMPLSEILDSICVLLERLWIDF